MKVNQSINPSPPSCLPPSLPVCLPPSPFLPPSLPLSPSLPYPLIPPPLPPLHENYTLSTPFVQCKEISKETKVVAFSTSLLARGYKITIAGRTIKLTPFRRLDIGTGFDTTRLIPAFGTNVGLTVFSFMSAVL